MKLDYDRLMKMSPLDRMLLAFVSGITVGSLIMALLVVWIVKTA